MDVSNRFSKCGGQGTDLVTRAMRDDLLDVAHGDATRGLHHWRERSQRTEDEPGKEGDAQHSAHDRRDREFFERLGDGDGRCEVVAEMVHLRLSEGSQPLPEFGCQAVDITDLGLVEFVPVEDRVHHRVDGGHVGRERRGKLLDGGVIREGLEVGELLAERRGEGIAGVQRGLVGVVDRLREGVLDITETDCQLVHRGNDGVRLTGDLPGHCAYTATLDHEDGADDDDREGGGRQPRGNLGLDLHRGRSDRSGRGRVGDGCNFRSKGPECDEKSSLMGGFFGGRASDISAGALRPIAASSGVGSSEIRPIVAALRGARSCREAYASLS